MLIHAKFLEAWVRHLAVWHHDEVRPSLGSQGNGLYGAYSAHNSSEIELTTDFQKQEIELLNISLPSGEQVLLPIFNQNSSTVIGWSRI